MAEPRVPRGRFLALAVAAQAAAATGVAGAQVTLEPTQSAPANLKRSLVLSGGGALGAYEAGVVQALVAAAGVLEGQPLPDYGVIAGTSIGALNAYLVATAQWRGLRSLWSSVADENIIRLKPKYAKIPQGHSGLFNRLFEVIEFGVGAMKNVTGVYDGEFLESWLLQYIDFKRPVVTPLIWSVTNLTLQAPEYFYLLPPGFDQKAVDIALDSIRLALGDAVVVREAAPDPALLVKQLRASAAVPLAFDPVPLEGPERPPQTDQYVDGGVTANTPVGVARALSSAVDAVLLAPPADRDSYHELVSVAEAVFNTTQRRLMYDAIRAAYVETQLLRTLHFLPNEEVERLARATGHTTDKLVEIANLFAGTTFFVLRPQKKLPATTLGFDDAASITATYHTGVADGTSGFKPFDYRTIFD